MFKIGTDFMSILIFLLIMIVQFFGYSNGYQKSDIYHLCMKNRKFNDIIENNKIICVQPHSKSLQKIWSTAHLMFKSANPCKINEGINVTSLEHDKEQYSTYLSKIISKLKSFQESTNDLCQYVIYVPLYNKYCIDVEINGKLEVDYVFTLIDVKLVMICLLGIILYYSSTRLAKNELFHYFSGMSLGVIGSVIILLLIIMRFIPKKTAAFVTFVTGSSFFLFLTKWIYFNFKNLTESFQMYIVLYLSASALISALYCYYRGPVRNQRAINLIELLLKTVSMILIYFGASYKEISISLIIAFILVNLLYESNFRVINFPIFKKIKYKYFPPKRKLMTQEEYQKEALDYTQKALQDLRNYCSSPDCNAWKTISRISRPDRFAKFITDESFHMSDEEIIDYENYSISNDLIDDEDE